MNRLLRGLTAVAFAVGVAGAAHAADYKIMAPAGPGGGWDQTARSMQAALQDEKISASVQVNNVPGAGGTVGLAQFVNEAKGDPNSLIVGGYVMVGAILTNNSPVTLDQITPIARLTGEYEAIVVPAASDIQDMAGLVAKLKADPGAVSWAGGSAGGVDHITAGLVAKAVGVDPTKINYVAFSGGGEALAAILGNQVTVGISGYGEFAEQVKAGTMRLIGVSSAERLAGIDAPTFKESGADVVIQNWRMVAAAPDITAEQKAAIGADIEKMVNSPTWQKILADKGWANTYLAGDAFAAQLQKDIESTSAILKDDRPRQVTGETGKKAPGFDPGVLVIAGLLIFAGAVIVWSAWSAPAAGGYARIGPTAAPWAIGVRAPDPRCGNCGFRFPQRAPGARTAILSAHAVDRRRARGADAVDQAARLFGRDRTAVRGNRKGVRRRPALDDDPCRNRVCVHRLDRLFLGA